MGGRKPVSVEILRKRELKNKKIVDKKREKDPFKEKIKLIRKTAEKNVITEKRLDKLMIPKELHEAVRITAEKIHGRKFIFLEGTVKKLSVVIKGGVIIISGVTAMQIPRMIKQFEANKKLLEEYGVKDYTIKKYLEKNLKDFDVAIAVPQNVFSKESWQNYARNEGASFFTGAIIATASLIAVNHFIKRAINNYRAKSALKKTQNYK
jgi:hypothetical protein